MDERSLDWDVFNGDADGICALLQLRLAESRVSRLITGVKRDISLLDRVDAVSESRVTVLDISLDKNHDHLKRLLDTGSDVLYIDHHFASDIPKTPNLEAIINCAPDVCTSILVNNYLKGRYKLWAIVGAYGDNLKKEAAKLAKSEKVSEFQLSSLERLGVLINYNGYGGHIGDLHFHPASLYEIMLPFGSPFEFIRHSPNIFEKLDSGYNDDFCSAENAKILFADDSIAIYVLPDKPWARRIGGVYGNYLANKSPQKAHSIFTEKPNGNYLVSVRAPLTNKTGAAKLCNQFPTGGGRQIAAGINDLPSEMVGLFVSKFKEAYK